MMDISDLACVPIPASQPDLTPLRVPAISHAPVSIPPHSHSQTQPTVGSHTDNASVRQSLQPTGKLNTKWSIKTLQFKNGSLIHRSLRGRVILLLLSMWTKPQCVQV